MLSVVEAPGIIRRRVATLRKEIAAAATWSGLHRMGFQGGTEEVDVSWLENHGFFLATFEDADNRAWNAFGLVDPATRDTLPLVVEINVPWEGIDRRIGGVFLASPSGELLLGHRGAIGGGREGIGRTRFFDAYRGKITSVVDGDRTSEVAVIAALDSPELLPAIATFVREVDRIKEQAVGGRPIRDVGFTPEFEGTKRYERRTSEVVYLARHGTVVRALADALAGAGHRVTNDRERDLFVRGRGKKVRHLFEVKTVVASTEIYAAVGQLLVNGRARDESTELHLVVPLQPTPRFAYALDCLGVGVIVYDWNGGSPTFEGLPDA